MIRALNLLLLLACAAAPCWAQSDVFWDDPSLEDAVRDADLVVLAQAKEVGPHEVRYEVLRTLKGPERKGATLRVQGLFHPDLADGPPSQPEERAFLILRGEASGDSFLVPTPTFGRFPIRRFGASELAVACLGDTFVRLPLDPELYAQFLSGLAAGQSTKLITAAREALQAQLEAEPLDSTALYVNLRLLACFGAAGDEPLLIKLLDRAALGAPDRYRLRMAAAQALGALRGPRAASVLSALALDDEVPAVQTTAIRALERLVSKLDAEARKAALAPLIELAQTAKSEATVFSGAEDPRRNVLPSPLSAALLALALHAPAEGTRAALAALERADADAVGSGLVFFQVLGDRDAQAVPLAEIASRMRPADHEDVDLNLLFARTLRMLTGEDLGPSRDAWLTKLGAPGGEPR
ncbi:MAG: HEAT repeat domain-containing protein [Planctomycetes bacterium]|nr:HEAT repeat domain-containing protein [Planctomycetota bacterium]